MVAHSAHEAISFGAAMEPVVPHSVKHAVTTVAADKQAGARVAKKVVLSGLATQRGFAAKAP